MKDLLKVDPNQIMTHGEQIFRDIFGLTHPGSGVDFPVDITEDDQNFYLRAEMPGLTKDDIDVLFEDGVIKIRAEKRDTTEETGKHFIRKETSYGMMERTFSVGKIDAEKIQATFKDGILSVTLVKEDPGFKRIDIK